MDTLFLKFRLSNNNVKRSIQLNFILFKTSAWLVCCIYIFLRITKQEGSLGIKTWRYDTSIHIVKLREILPSQSLFLSPAGPTEPYHSLKKEKKAEVYVGSIIWGLENIVLLICDRLMRPQESNFIMILVEQHLHLQWKTHSHNKTWIGRCTQASVKIVIFLGKKRLQIV